MLYYVLSLYSIVFIWIIFSYLLGMDPYCWALLNTKLPWYCQIWEQIQSIQSTTLFWQGGIILFHWENRNNFTNFFLNILFVDCWWQESYPYPLYSSSTSIFIWWGHEKALHSFTIKYFMKLHKKYFMNYHRNISRVWRLPEGELTKDQQQLPAHNLKYNQKKGKNF